MRTVPYPTPGEILLHEFLGPMGVTQDDLAQAIGVPLHHIAQIVAGETGVTASVGLRLSRYFGTSDAYWSGLQASYELAKAREELAEALADIKPLARL